MQVNNNTASPNFGMALKITKGGKEYLQTKSMDALNALGDIGEKMKDYKHYDLLVDGTGYTIVPKDCLKASYTGDMDCRKLDNHSLAADTIEVKAKYASHANKGNDATLRFELLNRDTIDGFEKIGRKGYDQSKVERYALVTQLLEEEAAKKAAEEAAKKAHEQAIANKVNDLVSRFSVDA